MMSSKLVVVFSTLLALAVCAPASDKEPVAIVSQNAEVQPDGTFQWNYESADGTKQEQNGAPKPVDKEIAEVVQGSVAWTDPEGGKHQLSYVADENGFQAQGGDLPVAPEVPPQIARALEWIAQHPEPEQKKL